MEPARLFSFLDARWRNRVDAHLLYRRSEERRVEKVIPTQQVRPGFEISTARLPVTAGFPVVLSAARTLPTL